MFMIESQAAAFHVQQLRAEARRDAQARLVAPRVQLFSILRQTRRTR